MAFSKEEASDFCESDIGKSLIKSEVAILLHEIHKGEKVLDVGSGLGIIEKYLTGMDITGLESSEEMLASSRRNLKNLFVKGRAENLPFLKETFDLALFSVLPDPVTEYARALNEIVAVLKKKGRIIIPTLNSDSAYFSALSKYKPGYAEMARSVRLDYLEEAMPKLMKFTEVKTIDILHALGSNAAKRPDMYVAIYSKP